MWLLRVNRFRGLLVIAEFWHYLCWGTYIKLVDQSIFVSLANNRRSSHIICFAPIRIYNLLFTMGSYQSYGRRLILLPVIFSHSYRGHLFFNLSKQGSFSHWLIRLFFLGKHIPDYLFYPFHYVLTLGKFHMRQNNCLVWTIVKTFP